MFWYIVISLVVGFFAGAITGYFFAKRNPEDMKKVDETVTKIKEKIK